jgi:hypothetical protein
MSSYPEDPRADAGAYSAPSPRIAKNRQDLYEAPWTPLGQQDEAAPSHSVWDAMVTDPEQPGSRG